MKRIKRKSIFAFVFLAVLCGYDAAAAAPMTSEPSGEAILDEISLDGVRNYWDKLVRDYGGYVPELEKMSLYEFIKSQGNFSLKGMVRAFVDYLFHELIINGKLLGTLFMLTLFSVVLQTMHSAFEQKTVSKIAYFVIYLVLIYLALNSFYLAVSYAQEAIDAMKGFMIALLPLVLGMMASFGNVMSVAFFHPIIIFLINFSGILVSSFILPLLFLSALLQIVSSMNENYKVTHLANLLRNVGIGTLGVFLTIFLGVISIQGTASAIQDGIALKTAKFITGNFIPVVGKTFTEAADTILSASMLLKNAVGMAGLFIILLLVLFPVIKIAAIAFIYKFAAAAIQPIGNSQITGALNTISNYILYVLACLLAVSLMFLLAIVIIISASNITLLLR